MNIDNNLILIKGEDKTASVHWISVLLRDEVVDVVAFLTNVSFEATKAKTKPRKAE